jgi:hypothetical protein
METMMATKKIVKKIKKKPFIKGGIPKVKINKPPKCDDPMVDELYEDIIEFMCPIRGLVKQKVWVKRLKSLKDNAIPMISTLDDVVEKIDKKNKENEDVPFDDEAD